MTHQDKVGLRRKVSANNTLSQSRRTVKETTTVVSVIVIEKEIATAVLATETTIAVIETGVIAETEIADDQGVDQSKGEEIGMGERDE